MSVEGRRKLNMEDNAKSDEVIQNTNLLHHIYSFRPNIFKAQS